MTHLANPTDLVIGADGIRSKMRRLMLGTDHPAAYPSYSHKYAIRGLIPMPAARAAIGDFKTSNRIMHCGPHAHALTFPVAAGTLLNVVAFVTDPGEWSAPDGKLTAPASKSEATQAFAAFSPVVRRLMDLLPEQLDKWAVFDTRDNPVPTYVDGRICLAGDAAHAASPHHGAGAGCGIEDCLALAELFDAVAQCEVQDRPSAVRTALRVYNDVRYERSQWLVDSSRVIGDVYEFMGDESGADHDKIGQQIFERSHKIWDFDVEAMVEEVLDKFGHAMDEVWSDSDGGEDGAISPVSESSSASSIMSADEEAEMDFLMSGAIGAARKLVERVYLSGLEHEAVVVR
jgi:2-polyprenyl-6-methoxyphenol hydroxylase-like FAD-dependent oxidoreductase